MIRYSMRSHVFFSCLCLFRMQPSQRSLSRQKSHTNLSQLNQSSQTDFFPRMNRKY